SPQQNGRGQHDHDDAQIVERIDEAQVVELQQPQVQEELHGHEQDAGAEKKQEFSRPESVSIRELHRVFQNNLASDLSEERDHNDHEGDERHSRSSRRATGFATTARPNVTRAMPHQRRLMMTSPRKIQLQSGIRTWTAWEMGKARERGM